MNKTIEYTNLLNPITKELKRFVKEGIDKNVYGIVVRPQCLNIVKKSLKNTDLKSITVAGFPPLHSIPLIKKNPKKYAWILGSYNKRQRNELHMILDEDPDELDIIFPFYWYVKGHLLRCRDWITGIKKRVKFLKVIIELGTFIADHYSLFEITSILKDSGVDMVKTNSGILSRDFKTLIALLQEHRDTLLPFPIKASGGIRTKEQVEILLNLGVKRIGTSDISKIL